jgi:hypothetical protein
VKVFASYSSDKRLISRIYKELKKLNSKIIIQLINGQMNRQFSEVQVTNKYMEKCSASFVIKEMQIKTTLRFCLTRVRMAVIKKTNNNKYW